MERKMTLQILESARLAWNELSNVFPGEDVETYKDIESFEIFYELLTANLLSEGKEEK